jgi:hypothetical protein
LSDNAFIPRGVLHNAKRPDLSYDIGQAKQLAPGVPSSRKAI